MDILHTDNHLLVVSKPAGLLVQADATGDADLLTLAKAWIAREYDKPGAVYLGLVHRLDRPVSGVVVLARTSKAASRLSEQFRRRRPRKLYLAQVEGAVAREGRFVDHLLKGSGASNRERRVRSARPGTEGALEARLSWRRLAERDGLSLVEVALETGRPHQIRAQFAQRGHPLRGDFLYGATREFDGRNLALHALSLEIEHPVRREPMRFHAPPPASWGSLFAGEIAGLLPG